MNKMEDLINMTKLNELLNKKEEVVLQKRSDETNHAAKRLLTAK